jgi:hypothetical protein
LIVLDNQYKQYSPQQEVEEVAVAVGVVVEEQVLLQ